MFNKVDILGTITKDIELKYTQSGTAIANFSIACNERYKQQNGEYVDKAYYFDVTAFGKRCEVIKQYFRKGSRILISGSLDYQSWTTQEGQNRSKVGIKLNDFDFIDKKDSQSNNDQPSYQQPAQQAQPYQAPQPQYQNAQGQQVTQQQYQNSKQVTTSMDVDNGEIPF